MLDQRVAVRTRGRELVGIAHADQVGRKATAKADALRDDVPPDVRAGGIPMQEYDRVARADINIGHFLAENLDEFLCPSSHYKSLQLVRGCGSTAHLGEALAERAGLRHRFIQATVPHTATTEMQARRPNEVVGLAETKTHSLALRQGTRPRHSLLRTL